MEGASRIAAPTNFHPHNVPFGCAGGGCGVDLPSPSPNPHGFYWGGREPRTKRTGMRRGSWPQRLPSRFGSSPPWQEKPAQPGSAPNAGCQQKLGRRKGKGGEGGGEGIASPAPFTLLEGTRATKGIHGEKNSRRRIRAWGDVNLEEQQPTLGGEPEPEGWGRAGS